MRWGWVLSGLLVLPGLGRTQARCQLPPLSGTAVPPNLIIVLDKSGSMQWRAAWQLDPDGPGPRQKGEYDPNYEYYGNFNSRKLYRYQSGEWRPIGPDPNRDVIDVSDRNNPVISGNLLNWALMSRMDVLKRVLTGGEGDPTGQLLKNSLKSRGSGYGWPAQVRARNGKNYQFSRSGGSTNTQFVLREWSGSTWSQVGVYSATVDVSSEPIESRIGIFRQLADKDLDGRWDRNTPRWGVFAFDANPLRVIYEPFEVEFDPDIKRLYDAINGIYPGGGTGVGDALLAAYHYLAWKQDNHWNTFSMGGGAGGTKDPWKDWRTGEPMPCRQSFVLIIGDGESNSDDYLLDSGHFPGYDRLDYDGDGNPGDTDANWRGCCSDCDGCDDIADDYACYMNDCRGRGVDIRTDIPGTQLVKTYAIFTFGHVRGYELFRDIARNGDGEAYSAYTGRELEEAVRNALLSIISRAQSGTAAGVVSTGSKGEGTTAMAFYFARHPIPGGSASWIGDVRAFWIDPWGNLRGDNGNRRLELTADPIIRMLPPASGNLYPTVELYSDANGDGNPDGLIGVTTTRDTSFMLWSAGWRLRERAPANRNIWVNLNKPLNLRAFNPGDGALLSALAARWGLPTDTVRARVEYIRGRDQAGYRNRKLDLSWPDEKTWKLGDIVYGTPTFVGPPAENYHILYGDATYAQFYEAHKDRRGTFYVGANDGMLHAFNAGRYVSLSSGTATGELRDGGVPLGEELWALIPEASIGGLKDYPTKDYCHAFYVDLKGKATDVRIFGADATHPHGWGTLLIQGMRLGCGITNQSSYIFLDVTRPDVTQPQLLYEFSDRDLGFTTPYPAVAKVRDKWFALLGSGPDSLDGWTRPSKAAYFYVVDLGSLTGPSPKVFKFRIADYLPGVGDQRAYLGDPVAVDVDLNYHVDVIYFPVIEGDQAYLVRVNTGEDPDPRNWTFTRVMDLPRPQVAAVNVSLRQKGGQLWVFGGTGRFFNMEQADTNRMEYFYGILDPWTTTGSGPLVSFLGLLDVTGAQTRVDTVTHDATIRLGAGNFSPESLVSRVVAQGGWRIAMRAHKVLAMPLLFGGVVYFTTFNLSRVTPCEAGGSSYLWALQAELGAPTTEAVLGLNPDQTAIGMVRVGSGLASSPVLHVGENSQSVIVQTGEGVISVTRERDVRRLPSHLGLLRPVPAQ